MNEKHQSITKELDHLILKTEKHDLSMQEIIQELGFRGHAFVTLILGVPFCSPLPTFGLSAIFGAVIAVVSVFIFLNKEPYLPEKFKNRKIPKEHLNKFLVYSKKFLTFLEKFVKPRMHFMSKIFPIRTSSAIMIFCCGVLLALPLPPGTNAPPAITIVILSLALLEEDNLFFILGGILFISNILLFGTIAAAGVKAVDYVLQYFA